MMAATILAVAFIGMIQAVTISSEMLDTARKQQVATQIIDEEIEQLRATSWSTLANLNATGTIDISSAGVVSGDPTRFALSNYTTSTADDNTALCLLARGFTCSYTRTYLRPASATASNVTFIKVVYTVTWRGNTGRSFRRSSEAYFGLNGLQLSYQRS